MHRKGLVENGEYWFQLVCSPPGPGSEDEKYFVGVGRQIPMAGWLKRIVLHGLHSGVPVWQSGDAGGDLRDKVMNLEILRSCRQVYQEAMPFLYSRNTFSFANPNCLQQFINGRKAFQRLALRNLRLVLDFDNGRDILQ